MARFDTAAIRHHHTIPSIAATVMELKRVGGEHIGCCPFHDDRRPSLTVYDQGRKFKCFGCGAQGDAIDFVKRLYDVEFREAAEILGGNELPRVVISMQTAEQKQDRRPEAMAMWHASQRPEKTVVQTYLNSRGLFLPIPKTIRFATLPYGKFGPLYPVMLALVTDVDDQPIGVQRTYLSANGIGKAGVQKAKLSLGAIRTGTIRLAPCESTLTVTEGAEDAMTLLQRFGAPVWAAVGASNLATVKLPDAVTSVTIGADADAAGEQAARSAAERFASQGREVRIIRPRAPFKDFNAELMAAAQ